jgi:hypothetical protein
VEIGTADRGARRSVDAIQRRDKSNHSHCPICCAVDDEWLETRRGEHLS